MLAFVTSLRHPDNAADYGRVEELLRRTLRSIAAQTSDDYVVIVVGNRAPSFALPPRMRFVPVDFPPQPEPTKREERWETVVVDKGSKLGVGLLAAREYEPDHVMVVDADDFVHRDLVRWVGARSAESGGWLIADGWRYSSARGAGERIDDLYRVCGTCYIVPWRAYAVPELLPTTASQDEVIAAFGERARFVLGKHRDADLWFAEHGFPLEPLPFPGSVYHVDTGENHSGKRIDGDARMLPRSVAAEFGLTHTHPWIVRWWRCEGRTLRERIARRARRLMSRST
ncbi:glycosyltransferase family 2 protein [Microbacterium karelineae]|uniref:glycosyltransferase family 2 protein n=1 Tax=Microbacterium karelineae TaxID=2654283 RepID=UPI0012EA804E|nr:glycosyltransferase family 2 protein [Microbacterium karelineae]